MFIESLNDVKFACSIFNMKNYFLAAALILSIAACKSDKKPSNVPENAINPEVLKNPASASGEADANLPSFEFKEETHDFGKIVQGEKVSYDFQFKNSGKGDLVISGANGSCGCTVPEYPKEAISPGGTGTIKVTFDSGGRQGHQEKTVTLVANTVPNTKVLKISATVDLPEGK
jgi:hypothetical protein